VSVKISRKPVVFQLEDDSNRDRQDTHDKEKELILFYPDNLGPSLLNSFSTSNSTITRKPPAIIRQLFFS
jgi:hypothetical protein